MKASSAVELLLALGHGDGGPEHDHGPIVHRVLEDGAREHDPVDERHREAGGDPGGELAERSARGGAVDVDPVADPGVKRRDDVGLPVVLEAQVGRRGPRRGPPPPALRS